MSDDGRVTTAVADGVATLTFGHPKGNSLPGALLRELAAAIVRLGNDTSARVIVIRSEGAGAFCAGASFAELQSITDREAGKKFFSGFATLILAMIRCPRLIVTRVQGKTVGGGVGIVAASDYVVASTEAAVRLSELAVGIGPFVVGPVIERKIGLAAFSAMAVDADWRSAEWAERHGLFSSVESAQNLDTTVDAIVARLVASNPDAMTRLKKVFWQGTEEWGSLLSDRAETSGELVLSEFARAAIGRK